MAQRLAFQLVMTAVLLLGITAHTRAAGLDISEEFQILTVHGATDRKVRTYPGRTSLKQLDYVVKLAYPKAAIDSTQLEQLGGLGWKGCDTRTKGWDSIPDNRDKANPRCNYVLSKSLIKANTLMRITMEYQRKLTKRWICEDEPDNSRQHVQVAVYSFPDRESMHLEEQGLSCPESVTRGWETPNTALLTDAFHSALRAARGAAKRER
jgi:hypothetical protein